MSIRIMAAVLDHFPVGGNRKLALLCLADHANDSGTNCYPSIRKIAERVCCSDDQARRHIHALIDDGFVSVEPGTENGGGLRGSKHGKPRRYRINLDRLTPRTDASPRMDASPSMDDGRPLASSHDDPSHPCKPNHQEPSKKRESTPAREAVPLPKGFWPADAKQVFWLERGLTNDQVSAATFKFISHHKARGTRFVDWTAAWEKWMTDEDSYMEKNGRLASSRKVAAG
jgi:hypothetical protein